MFQERWFVFRTSKPRATNVLRLLAILVCSALVPVSLSSTAYGQSATDFSLHGTGANANPATLFLNTTAPTATTEKYKDSGSVNFNGGNPWQTVGTWPANPVPSSGTLSTLAPLHVWLGLKNSDDQGTNFDVRAELSKNGTVFAAGQTLCVTGITRNANSALDTAVSFGSFTSQTFNGSTDGLSLKVLTRIGTNPDGTKCAGHNNAVGLRLYFDATSRAAKFSATLGAPNPVPTALVPDPLPITVGATGTLTATLSPAPTAAGSLAVSSSATAVATAPASVAFTTGQTSVSIPVTAVSPGSTLITVSLNGGSITSTAQVTPAPPTVTSVVPDTMSITQGGSGTLTVTINAAQTANTSVTLTSSAPPVAFVPSSVTVLAGQVAASFSVSANSPGTAQITASLNGTSANSTITVTPAPPTVVSVLPATSSVTLGATTSVSVTISSAQPGNTVMTISTSPSGIISVPATVTVTAGQTSADIPIGTVALGTASVQASVNGSSAQAAVQVVPPTPTLVSLLPSELSIEVGATSTFTVTLNAAQLTNTVIPLSVDHPDRLLAPSSVTVPAGDVSASFTVTGQVTGDAVITGTLNGASQSATVHVVPIPAAVVSLQPTTLSIQQGANGTFTLTINVAQSTDTSIPLTNTAPAVLQAPSAVTVPAGDVSVEFSVLGLSTGSATISASLNATTVSATVQVTPQPTIVTGLTPATQSLPKGSPGVLHVAVSPASASPQTVTITSSNSSIVQAPATVTIPAGDVGADFPVFSLAEGSATITATLGSGSANAQVTVTPAKLTAIAVSPDNPTIFVGETQSFTAIGTYTDSTTQNLSATVTWSSSDQAVASINSSGVASAVAAGTATISAASESITGSALLTVMVPPPPTMTSFTPTSGPVGTVVTISGTNFGPTAAVLFNGVQAEITSSTMMIAASVPEGATTGPITVTTAGGSVTSTTDFTVTSPHIVSVSPTSGPPGTAVTITGLNFDPVAANNQVRFNGTAAIITSATATTIQTTVPMDATSGSITVTTPLGTAVSPQPFEVTRSSDFSVEAIPSVLVVTQGGGAAALISLSSTGLERFTGLAALSVSGLPAGATALFDPPQLTSGRSGNLRVAPVATTPIGDASVTISAEAVIDGHSVTHTATMIVRVVAGGQTVLAGQFLTVDGQPIPNVQVRMGTYQTQSDSAGNFLMVDVPAGTQQLMIDANSAVPGYPMYAADVPLTAGETTDLPPFRITAPPPPERFTPIANATTTQVITDPQYPGLALTLPAGVTITGWDGVVKTQIALGRVDADRLPVLPPPGGAKSFYQVFFGTPMGGVPSAPLPVAAPNDLDLDPGDQAQLWYYNASPMGGPAGWTFAGTGTVSLDGSQIVSDAGVGIQRFCGVCGLFCWLKNQDSQPNNDTNSPTGADPVNLGLGQQIVQKTDLVLPGRLPLALSRIFNPYDAFNKIGSFPAPLGVGWMLSVDVVLLQENVNIYRLILPGNTRLQFNKQPNGTFLNASGFRLPEFVGAVLSTLPGGDLQLRFKDGATWKFQGPLFGAALFLVEQADRVGNRITIHRTSGSPIQSIEDSAGRAINFQYTNGRITQLTDPMGRTVQYSYHSDGRLATMTDPEGGVTHYTYAASGGIETITDARNITYLTNEYTGRYLTRQTLADGGQYRFYYRFIGFPSVIGCSGGQPECPFTPAQQRNYSGAGSGNVVVPPPVLVETVMRDPQGHDTRYQKVLQAWTPTEQLGEVQMVTDALGQVTTTVRNRAGQPTLVTDPLGRSTRYTYDERGNLITLTDPENHVTSFEYETTFSRVTRITDALNQVTRFEYDAQGNLTATEDPTSARTTLAYNGFGQPTSVTDALNNTTAFEYDSVGNLVATSDPLGNTTRRAYDAVSRLTGLTDPRGFTTHYDYDDLNRVTQITDALNGLTAFGYDSNGNLLSVTDANNHTTTYGYDNMDRLETRSDPLNRSESYTYDPTGNLATFTDRKGQLSQFTYDAVNRRAHAQYADGSETSFAYDAGGRMVAAEDSTSGRIEQTYDGLDRLVQELTPQGVVSYIYDVLGRRHTMTVSGQGPVTYQYDAASRLTQVSQGTLTVGLGYDVEGRRSSLTYPNGVTTSYGYDTASRLTSIVHQGPTALIETFTYTYDAAGNRIGVARGNNQAALLPGVVQAAYDAANQQVQFNGTTPNSTYDANGNLISQIDTTGTTTYTWDARNRLVGIDGLSVSASFGYDVFGRRLSKTVNGVSSQYLYDDLDVTMEFYDAAPPAFYLQSLNVDEIFIRNGSTSEYFHQDANGSTSSLTDYTGSIQTTYKYEPFGETTVLGASTNQFQYTGRENDVSGLFYYRARYYASTQKRFLSEDSLRFYSGDTNFYSYVQNNPVNYSDPDGLSPVGWIMRLVDKGKDRVVKALYSKADAVRAREAGKDIQAASRQAAHEIEQANAGGKRIEKHEGHDLGEGRTGRPHYQTPGKRGHTFWGLVATVGSLVDPFDAISGELSDDDMLPLGCRKPPCQ